jgi:uncharacterized protein YcbK (DUF882 family)
LRFVEFRAGVRTFCLSIFTSAAFIVASAVLMPASTETAVANGDTRTLHLYHTHTGETIDATFRVDGHYDQDVLRQLNHFLRDWRNNDEISMDPRLFDAVWEAYRSAGATDRVQIYSAYRSPETNAMLRRRSKAVAEHSQHMLGKAMDTTMPGFPMDRVRDAGMKLQHGGVGWYPSANFVPLDVGGVRSWPRMPYDQLASLFPDGKTVHIASNGQTLPGYEQARQELAQRGQGDLPPSQESGGFFAWLFGGGSNTTGAAHEDEEDRRVAVAAVAPQPVQQVQQEPVRQEQPAPEPQQQAAAPQPAIAYAETRATSPLVAQAQGSAPQASDQSGTVQLASLETAPAVMPLPPRRPSEFAIAPEIPLPPARPDRMARVQEAALRRSVAPNYPAEHDAIGSLITSTASGVPMLRRSSLPAIITQGSGDHRRMPDQALALAADAPLSDQPPSLRAMPPARPESLAKPTGLRTARRQTRTTPSLVATSADEPVVSGPRVTGLRRAARMLDQKASL